MDKCVLEKAGKDVKAIRETIEMTTEGLLQLGKIFIGWGMAFLVLFIGVIAAFALKAELTDIIASYPVIIVIPLVLTAGAASVSYFAIRRKGLHGLTKPLLAVWLAIIAYVTLSHAFGYLVHLDEILKAYRGVVWRNGLGTVYTPIDSFFLPYRNIGGLLFAFAFGLLCMRLFSRLKFAGVLACIYLLLILAHYASSFLFGPENGQFFSAFSVISYSLIVPVTFLIVGGYLEFSRARRN
jgi:hypothetical protein